MNFKYINTVLYENDGIIITEYHYPNIPFLDNLEYEDDIICFTADKMKLALASKTNYKNDSGIIDINQIESKDLIDILLIIANANKKTYFEGVNEGNIFKATIFCDKRDLTKMFYKLLKNNNFTYKQLYQYAVESYSRIEDSYGYNILADGMEYCIKNDKSIKNDVIISLQEYLKDDKLIAYRGINKNNRINDGLSYTLDIKVANFFAKRWESEGIINTYEIDIKDILAFIDNGELEIVSKKSKLLQV